jgi:hypothetical protein
MQIKREESVEMVMKEREKKRDETLLVPRSRGICFLSVCSKLKNNKLIKPKEGWEREK